MFRIEGKYKLSNRRMAKKTETFNDFNVLITKNKTYSPLQMKFKLAWERFECFQQSKTKSS